MKIVIGTPNFTGAMESEVAVTMARCIREWSKNHDIHWLVPRRNFICKARHIVANQAVMMGADYVFWVDDDALIKPDILDRLIAHDKDIVITPYPLRRPPYLCGVLRSKTGNYMDQDSYENLSWDEMNQGLIEVDGGGTHAMLTKASLYGPPLKENEQLEEYAKENPGKVPFPWFVLAPYGGTEDMYFCLVAKKVGIKIYCDTDIEAGHIGYPEILTSGNGKSWQRKFGLQTLEDVSKKLPAGSSYIDVEAAENYGATPTTTNISDANAVAASGSEQAI